MKIEIGPEDGAVVFRESGKLDVVFGSEQAKHIVTPESPRGRVLMVMALLSHPSQKARAWARALRMLKSGEGRGVGE